MWDYGDTSPMPLESFTRQLAAGSRLVEERRLEGLILLASCNCDLELDTVKYARE